MQAEEINISMTWLQEESVLVLDQAEAESHGLKMAIGDGCHQSLTMYTCE